MSFSLRRDESVVHGLRRLARKQLASARQALAAADPPAEDAVHEARTSLKKARAVLKVFRADEAQGLRSSRQRLRRANRTLSDLRDADATRETLTALQKRHPELVDEHTAARICRRLTEHKQHALARARDEKSWSEIDRHLKRARKAARGWRPEHDGFAVLEVGLRETYRAGQNALARARRTKRAGDFHEWRKQVKALWYQVRLLQDADPAVASIAAELHQTEGWLGEDHNLVVLCGELSKGNSARDRDRLTAVVAGDQSALRTRAVAAGKRIYAESPKRFVRRLKRAWHAWRRAAKPPTARRSA